MVNLPFKEKTLFHGSPHQNLKVIKPTITNAYKELGETVFASSLPAFASCFGAHWSDNHIEVGVTHTENSNFPKENRVIAVIFIIKNLTDLDMSAPCSMYTIKGSFRYLKYDKDIEQLSRDECTIIDEKKFKSFEEMMKYYGVHITSAEDVRKRK